MRYALVEGAGKKVIVKINDVGPLEPGRTIDFNRLTMCYFDPSLRGGLVHNIKSYTAARQSLHARACRRKIAAALASVSIWSGGHLCRRPIRAQVFASRVSLS